MLLKILNLAMFVVMVIMNYLANALPLNGKTTGELSGEYPNLFVPAGITFSIWGVIYILLLITVIAQFFSSNEAVIRSIGYAFAISSLLNALWIIAWHYQNVAISVVIMLGLLLALIYINFQLSGSKQHLFKLAFGIYLGWICIATIANITALLVSYNWAAWGLSQQTWAIIMIFAGAIICAIALIKLNNPFIALAVIWAFTGIIINRYTTFPLIVIAAIAAILAVTIIMIWGFRRYFSTLF